MSLSLPTEVDASDTDTINEIGRLRYDVWKEIGIDMSEFPDGLWVDDMDFGIHARHWVVRDMDTGNIVGAGRITRHESLDDNYRDIKLWKDVGIELIAPVVDFGRLVVSSSYRRRGIARSLVVCRLQAAKTWRINKIRTQTCVCTASEANMTVLLQLGFHKIGQQVTFPDRPSTVFHALQYNVPAEEAEEANHPDQITTRKNMGWVHYYLKGMAEYDLNNPPTVSSQWEAFKEEVGEFGEEMVKGDWEEARKEFWDSVHSGMRVVALVCHAIPCVGPMLTPITKWLPVLGWYTAKKHGERFRDTGCIRSERHCLNNTLDHICKRHK